MLFNIHSGEQSDNDGLPNIESNHWIIYCSFLGRRRLRFYAVTLWRQIGIVEIYSSFSGHCRILKAFGMGILDIDNHYKSMTLLENSTQRTITRREFFANIDSFCQLPTSGFEFSASTSFTLKSIGSTIPYAEIKNYVRERNPSLIQKFARSHQIFS